MKRLLLILAIALFLGAVLIMLTTQGDDDPDEPGNGTETSNDVGNVDGASDDFPDESPSASPSTSPSPSPSGSLPASTETLPPELANAGGRAPNSSRRDRAVPSSRSAAQARPNRGRTPRRAD